jgi:hypothetical protein
MLKDKLKSALIVINSDLDLTKIEPEDVIHMCLLENETPTQDDYDSLKNELKNDEEFGMTGVPEHLYIIMVAPPNVFKYFYDTISEDIESECCGNCTGDCDVTCLFCGKEDCDGACYKYN